MKMLSRRCHVMTILPLLCSGDHKGITLSFPMVIEGVRSMGWSSRCSSSAVKSTMDSARDVRDDGSGIGAVNTGAREGERTSQLLRLLHDMLQLCVNAHHEYSTPRAFQL